MNQLGAVSCGAISVCFEAKKERPQSRTTQVKQAAAAAAVKLNAASPNQNSGQVNQRRWIALSWHPEKRVCKAQNIFSGLTAANLAPPVRLDKDTENDRDEEDESLVFKSENRDPSHKPANSSPRWLRSSVRFDFEAKLFQEGGGSIYLSLE